MYYDYLVVGAGLFGAIFAREAADRGKSVLVIDKRDHIAGNIYTKEVEGINVHEYGAHIFHTNNKLVWNYINRFAEFNRYTNSPVANYNGEIYSLPFNMYTFNKMWNVVTPDEAREKIASQVEEAGITDPKNLEEQAISLVGTDIYEKLIKGYTEKQWGRDCKDLPSFIIKRLPVRYTYDNNYFNAIYQGIPIGGYTKMVENMLEGIKVVTNTDYFEAKDELGEFGKVVFTGPIDAYFDYKLGALEYRSVRFETETIDTPNFQGNAVVNYTDREKLLGQELSSTNSSSSVNSQRLLSVESTAQSGNSVMSHTILLTMRKNAALYAQYKELADAEPNVIFGGRLGEYKYYDMDKVIEAALKCVEKEFN